MTAPVRSVVAGVPALHLPGDGVTTGTLTFRAGLMDEDFPTTGTAHLVEHLVMSRVRRSTIMINAYVDPEETAFFARGPAPEVARFLSDVARAIQAVSDGIPPQEVDREIGVLAAEGYQGDPAGIPLTEIFGLVGPGLTSCSPVALAGITSDHVSSWARRFLVTGNAVLTVRGPWPEGLTLDLPAGRRNARPLPPRLPAGNSWPRQAVIHDIPFAVLGWERPVVSGASLIDRVVAERLTERVRHRLGRSYAVRTEAVLLDHETRHVSVVVDSARSQGRDVAVAAVREVVRLAEDGPEQAEIDHQLATFESLLADPEFGVALLGMAANRILTGLDDRLPLDGAEILDAMRAWTPRRVRDALSESQSTLAVAHAGPGLLTPTEVGLPLHVSVCTIDPIRGKQLKRRWRGSTAPRGVSLVHDDDSVGYQDGSIWHGVRFDDAVGVGIMGEGRLLTGRNGCSVVVDPADFRGADAVVRQIDARVPADRRYPVEPDL
jgi:hypothetical protein